MLPSKKLTTTLLPTLIALMALLVAACGGGGGTTTATPTAAPKAPQSQQIYRWAVPNSDIPTFDPGQSTDELSINAILLVYNGLVQLKDNLTVEPELAQSYDVSSDGLTYTFHLRSGLMFSDGTPLTSTDVAYSIDRALSPTIFNLSGVSLTYLGLIKDAAGRTTGKVASLINDSILTPDQSTVVLKLSKGTAYFLEALAYPASFVVERKLIDKYGLKFTDHLDEGGGSGPFKVKSYDHTTGIKLVRNDNYWGPKPQLAEIDQVFYKTSNTSYQAYLANQVDVTTVPSAEYQSAKTRPDFSQTPSLTIYYFAMNYNAKPFDNIHIRQAFELALNKDAIIKAVWKGRFVPTCHIVPQGMPGYDASLTCPDNAPTAGDATKAKALFQQGLQEEGYSSAAQLPPIKMTYETGSPDLANEITTAIGMWQQVLGVTVGTATLDFGPLLTAESATWCQTTYTKCTGKGLQMWAAGWGADYPDPQDWLTLQFGDNQPYNEFNYGNNPGSTVAQQQANQQAMDAADVMTDNTARMAAYNKAEQELVNEVAWLSLYQAPTARLRKPYVIGITPNAIGEIPPEDWANVYIAAH
ncbi:MAG TPA: peptide ABC transporter substrate-binding protein [Ktedonobacteraceae bacterium]|nr:peptide ABC transporter substrate-binding protein [Ktedonobacteraceae bacterium]